MYFYNCQYLLLKCMGTFYSASASKYHSWCLRYFIILSKMGRGMFGKHNFKPFIRSHLFDCLIIDVPVLLRGCSINCFLNISSLANHVCHRFTQNTRTHNYKNRKKNTTQSNRESNNMLSSAPCISDCNYRSNRYSFFNALILNMKTPKNSWIMW